ncbi:TetR family transcriptional regulator [Actinoplanes sp. NPDC049118]|uniref:TetR/AcrR family transcriptional regulator n=1 Tax=Actinoplanes sp. NPDC049118 TaxID=3155769 RepID=UPI003401B8A8
MTERLTRVQQQAVTRARLLDAAETLFGDRGIHQTSLDGIAAAAGLTKGAIYANFGSKGDLIAAILERKLGADEPEPPSASLAAWAGRLGDTYESAVDRPEIRRFALAFVELWLYGMRDGSARAPLAQWLQSVRDANAREAAELADDLPLPADQLAAVLLALDIGVSLQRLLDPRAVPVEVYTAGLKAILGRGPA